METSSGIISSHTVTDLKNIGVKVCLSNDFSQVIVQKMYTADTVNILISNDNVLYVSAQDTDNIVLKLTLQPTWIVFLGSLEYSTFYNLLPIHKGQKMNFEIIKYPVLNTDKPVGLISIVATDNEQYSLEGDYGQNNLQSPTISQDWLQRAENIT